MKPKDSLPVGVVLERRKIDNPWRDYSWRPVAVIPGAPPLAGEWTVLREGEGWTHFHAATLDIELYPKETDGYRTNLSDSQPHVFVVLRPDEDRDSPYEVKPFMVTVCPFEAESYLESGDEIVEGVPMPPDVIAWVQKFVDTYHVDVPFKKRKRKPYDPRKGDFHRRGGIGGTS